jgi:hypothetical protein
MALEDTPTSLQDKSLAELTRPACEIKKLIKDKTRKPQGAKATKVLRSAQYMNWFTPSLWTQIDLAA